MSKSLKLLYFLCVIPFSSQSAWAEEVLTLKQDHFTVTIPVSDTLTQEVFQRTASDLVDTIKKFAYPKVPEAILEKIKNRPIRIEFTSLDRGGGFSGELNASGELPIQLKQSYFKNPDIKSRLIHEWFHALHFVIHPNETSWIREGLATLFVYMTSDGVAYPRYPGAGLLDALSQSTTPLKYPFDPDQINSEAYGHVFFYFLDLYRNCGGSDLFWSIAQGLPSKFDEETLDSALKGSDVDFCGNFVNSAVHAEIARFHNETVYGPNDQVEKRYLVMSDLPSFGKLKTTPILNLKNDLMKLQPFQPLLISKEGVKNIPASVVSDPNVRIFTMEQDYPYSVRRWSPSLAVKGNSPIILLLRTR